MRTLITYLKIKAMTDSAEQAIKKADFSKEGMMEIHIGRMKVVVDFKSATIATMKDNDIVDKFNYEKEYSLNDFGRYIDNIIESDKKLGCL